MLERVSDLRQQRAAAFDAFKALADKPTLTATEQSEYAAKRQAVIDFDGRIERAQEAQRLAGASALPVEGQENYGTRWRAPVSPERDPYVSDEAAKARGLGTTRGLVVGGMMRMIGQAARSGFMVKPDAIASELYGESHPITRALITSVGASGGFIVPPDYMNEIIELLRPAAVVRAAGPRVIPMPRGTMTLPGQATPATASYSGEVAPIGSSQQTLDQLIASFKKLTALVPVSNDMMRYADPAVDAFVRDDLVKVIGLRQDLAFLLGDGTSNTPVGMTSFANRWAMQNGGTAGAWLSTANSTAAAGGNFITSNEDYSEATVVAELTGLVNQLDTANVPDIKRVWFFHPRTFNFLFGLLNDLGLYVFRDELSRGTLYGYPFKKTTQIPTNIWDATGTNKDCSFVILTEMDEAMILDSMTLELAVSREGTYVDASGTTWSAFQNDQTLVRAVAEHDFQMRHSASVAVDQFVRWAPALQ